jgi:hypothetical protein
MLYTWCAWCSGFYAMTARHSVFDDAVKSVVPVNTVLAEVSTGLRPVLPLTPNAVLVMLRKHLKMAPAHDLHGLLHAALLRRRAGSR